MKFSVGIFILITLSSVFCLNSYARPENIKPDINYYADDYTVENEVSELGEERNYEEVFKNYEFYEAVYDDQKRVKIFRCYKKGGVEWTEKYTYHPNGNLAKKLIVRGKDIETIEYEY